MNKKHLVLFAIGAILIIIIFLIIKYRAVLFNSAASLTPPTNPNTNPPPTSDFPLQVGSTGNTVKVLQIALNNMHVTIGPEILVEDGIFGPKTQAAVMKALNGNPIVTKSSFDTYILPWYNKATDTSGNGGSTSNTDIKVGSIVQSNAGTLYLYVPDTSQISKTVTQIGTHLGVVTRIDGDRVYIMDTGGNTYMTYKEYITTT